MGTKNGYSPAHISNIYSNLPWTHLRRGLLKHYLSYWGKCENPDYEIRNIGDVLLTSPMASALATLSDKPEVAFLVKKGTEEMLTGHPDIHSVLTLPEKKNGGKENRVSIASTGIYQNHSFATF